VTLTPSLFAVALCIAVLARAQAQEPTCPHQLTPIASSVSVTGVPSCPISDAPHTKFDAIATENVQGLVFAYSGGSQNCPGGPLSATIFDLPGECGGSSNTGQPVVCGPTLYSDPASPQEPSVTATLTFSYFNETEPNPSQPNVGPFSCEFVNFMSDSTPELSAANCPCPCPPPGPTLTFTPASPIISGTTTAISPPSGFSYVTGTSTYTSSNTDAVTLSATTAHGVAVGSSFISSAEMAYSPTSSYVATGCSVSSTILQSPARDRQISSVLTALQFAFKESGAAQAGTRHADHPRLLDAPRTASSGSASRPGGNAEVASPIVIDTKGQRSI